MGQIENSSTGRDIWIGKYASDKTYQWDLSIDGPASNADIAYAVDTDDDGFIYVTGSVGTVSNGEDIWVAKFAP